MSSPDTTIVNVAEIDALDSLSRTPLDVKLDIADTVAPLSSERPPSAFTVEVAVKEAVASCMTPSVP